MSRTSCDRYNPGICVSLVIIRIISSLALAPLTAKIKPFEISKHTVDIKYMSLITFLQIRCYCSQCKWLTEDLSLLNLMERG